MILIGLAGPAGCGKDVIGSHLTSAHGFATYAFAQPIKAMLVAGGLCDWGDFQDRERKEQGVELHGRSPRCLAQTLGTEWGRNMVHPDVWLRLAQQEFECLPAAVLGFVITDVRFENEASWVRFMGGTVWHIERGVEAVNEHSSEAGVLRLPGDEIIRNNGTIAELFAVVDGLVA